MLHLLDANILITAHNTYYPIERVPEYWEWILYYAINGYIKMPLEMIEEVAAGNKKEDKLVEWLSIPEHRTALCLDAVANSSTVQYVIDNGYNYETHEPFTDEQLERLGRDPFLIAYALDLKCAVVTNESRTGKKRYNQKIPDVCTVLGIHWCNTFELNRYFNFSTSWKRFLC